MSGRLARTSLAVALGFAALVTVQVLRLRRMEFLPLHPGFWVSHSVGPRGGRNAPSGPLRLIVFGDSTTAGVGVSRAEDSLPLVFAQRLADARGRSVAVLSYGWSGARMHDVLRDQLQRALLPGHQGQAPWLPTADVVIIVAGANDATHGTSPGRFRAALRATLEAIRREAPQAEITVAGIPRFRGALRQLEPLMSIIDAYAILLRGCSARRHAARRCTTRTCAAPYRGWRPERGWALPTCSPRTTSTPLRGVTGCGPRRSSTRCSFLCRISR